MEAALAASNGDPFVTLEVILGERNTLSSQNSQLWKIIEKQRGMYNNLHKELDRVKAERDRLQSKSSAETSSKRPSAGESIPRKQVPRSQSEDRRESQCSVYVLSST
jgi:RalA-binding protein 1